ncbi:MAG: TolC family protein [Gemmataceae bacterium]|nr:TolC family protein [Gemmataceae bacterium]
MVGHPRHSLRRLPRWQRIAWRLCLAGLPTFGSGCVDGSPVAHWFLPPTAPVIVQAAAEAAEVLPAPHEDSPLILTQAPELIPAPVSQAPTAAKGASAPVAAPKLVPISLDAILHWNDGQNYRVAQAHAKVGESEARSDIACKCIPVHCPPPGQPGAGDHGGAAYKKFAAERRLLEDRIELARLSSETLLDAASTYIDLLTATSGKTIAQGLEKDLQDVLGRARKLAETEPGAKVEVARVMADVEARRANVAKFEGQIIAASAKLIYLLGLDPCSQLVPADAALVPFELIDVNRPTCELVAQALAHGPGIQEMEALVNLVEDALARSEGGLGNLLNCRTRCERERIAEAQRAQVHLAYDDLRAKLTAGVQESQETAIRGRQEIRHSREQVTHAGDARDLSRRRLDNNVMGSSPSEVLLGQQSLSLANINYLGAVRDYNKAQLRLLILTGHHCGRPVVSAGNGLPAPMVEPKKNKDQKN